MTPRRSCGSHFGFLVIGLLAGSGGLSAQDPTASAPKDAVKAYAAEQARADQQTLRQAGLADVGNVLLTYFRQRTVSDDDRQVLLRLIDQLGADSFDTREAASEAIEAYGLAAVGLLRQAQTSPDVEVVLRAERGLQHIEKVPSATLSAAAARRLAIHQPQGMASVLLAYLPVADDELVAQEVRKALASVAVREGQANPDVVAALNDPLVMRQAAAAEAFTRAGVKDLLPRIRRMFRDARDLEFRIQVGLAFVTAAKDRAFVPELIDLLGQANVEQAWPIEDVLCRLAGEEAPAVSLGSDASSRRACREAWDNWWQVKGKDVDLGILDSAPRMLGYTVIMEMDRRNVNGRVFELGRDRKVRWEIEGLRMPMDAEFLPGNKMLIAEHSRSQVTERDMKGKILWQHRINSPVAIQRLRNGNLMLAGRDRVQVFDSNKQEVFTYKRSQYDIVAAQQTRSGETIFVTNRGNCHRLNRDGQLGKSFSVGPVNYYSGLQILPNQHILVTRRDGIAEYDLKTKKQVGETVPISNPTSVQKLPNGHYLVTTMNPPKVVELTRTGKEVWVYTSKNGNRPWKAFRR